MEDSEDAHSGYCWQVRFMVRGMFMDLLLPVKVTINIQDNPLYKIVAEIITSLINSVNLFPSKYY